MGNKLPGQDEAFATLTELRRKADLYDKMWNSDRAWLEELRSKLCEYGTKLIAAESDRDYWKSKAEDRSWLRHMAAAEDKCLSVAAGPPAPEFDILTDELAQCRHCRAVWKCCPPRPGTPPDSALAKGFWACLSPEFGKCCDQQKMPEMPGVSSEPPAMIDAPAHCVKCSATFDAPTTGKLIGTCCLCRGPLSPGIFRPTPPGPHRPPRPPNYHPVS